MWILSLYLPVFRIRKKFKYHYEFRDLNILDVSLLQLLSLLMFKYCPIFGQWELLEVVSGALVMFDSFCADKIRAYLIVLCPKLRISFQDQNLS